MQQYLINTTAIWLLSLLLFDVFLRRESYHSYNRFYLLFTLLLGALLPLAQWPQATAVYPTVLHVPVERVITARQTLASAATPSNEINWTMWLTAIYLIGAVTALSVLVADTLKLVASFRSGTTSLSGHWQLIETGKEHAPFSFRNTLFVQSRQQYNNDEWNMILTHEQRHSDLRHFADLLLIHLARIVFWFHPLVYIYHRRLLLVHEYQADNSAATQPQTYGRFLIEQAMLHAAPSLTHSFNRSPIKKRLLMLSRKSNTASRSKMLLLLPLLMVAAACFTRSTIATAQGFQKKGNAITYRGNTITLSESQADTIIVTDPVTGNEMMQVRRRDPSPLKINGQKIYNLDEVTTLPKRKDKMYSIEEHILSNLALTFNSFPDGAYRVHVTDVIIDNKGKMAYFAYDGLAYADRSLPYSAVPDDLVNKIAKELDGDASLAEMKPATLNGKNVAVKSDIYLDKYKFTVKNHVTTYSE